jgi:cytoskeletal protein CcmA (bactofilin family)
MAQKEQDMFGKSKDGSPDGGDRVVTPIPQPQRPLPPIPPAQKPGTDETSSISAGMTVIGKISGEGTVQVFGRVEGELRASTVLIAEGAEVEGDIIADDLSVGGRVKGTIHANRVKLNSSAAVEGDIFHRSLSIEENARFEGSSRREDAVLDTPRIPLGRAASQVKAPAHPTLVDGAKVNGSPDTAAHPAA